MNGPGPDDEIKACMAAGVRLLRAARAFGQAVKFENKAWDEANELESAAIAYFAAEVDAGLHKSEAN